MRLLKQRFLQTMLKDYGADRGMIMELSGLAEKFDIKADMWDDITSRAGWFSLAEKGLMLIAGALIFAAPPCSYLAVVCVAVICMFVHVCV